MNSKVKELEAELSQLKGKAEINWQFIGPITSSLDNHQTPLVVGILNNNPHSMVILEPEKLRMLLSCKNLLGHISEGLEAQRRGEHKPIYLTDTDLLTIRSFEALTQDITTTELNALLKVSGLSDDEISKLYYLVHVLLHQPQPEYDSLSEVAVEGGTVKMPQVT